jgi:hypothetical protein
LSFLAYEDSREAEEYRMSFSLKPERQRNDTTVTIFLPRHLRREVEEAARRDGISLSEVGRRAFYQFLQQHKDSDEAHKAHNAGGGQSRRK